MAKQEHESNESEGGHRKHHHAQHDKHGGACHKHGGHVKHKASGGKLPEKADGNPFVLKEAESKKSVGKIGGVKGKKRLDRKHGGRASGGADENPFSSAGHQLHHKRGGACH